MEFQDVSDLWCLSKAFHWKGPSRVGRKEMPPAVKKGSIREHFHTRYLVNGDGIVLFRADRVMDL